MESEGQTETTLDNTLLLDDACTLMEVARTQITSSVDASGAIMKARLSALRIEMLLSNIDLEESVQSQYVTVDVAKEHVD